MLDEKDVLVMMTAVQKSIYVFVTFTIQSVSLSSVCPDVHTDRV